MTELSKPRSSNSSEGGERSDYWGIRPSCGCITAWMAGDGVTPAEVREFYRNMADTGREVRRMAFTEELRHKIVRCQHRESEPS